MIYFPMYNYQFAPVDLHRLIGLQKLIKFYPSPTYKKEAESSLRQMIIRVIFKIRYCLLSILNGYRNVIIIIIKAK